MTLYLILHKVRGQPAFDVAERCDEMGTDGDPGPWWIIPTSGHRAFPHEAWTLDQIEKAHSEYPINGTDWDDLPDHYQVTLAPRKAKSTDAEEWALLAELGFTRKGAIVTKRFG